MKESFTAFGQRRNSCTWSGQPTQGQLDRINTVTRRGYTWHTALAAMGLNDMNGRIQDAVTGRFLSPDPYIPEPEFTQSYNRYSYVNNNPLTYVDPSGFDLESPCPYGFCYWPFPWPDYYIPRPSWPGWSFPPTTHPGVPILPPGLGNPAPFGRLVRTVANVGRTCVSSASECLPAVGAVVFPTVAQVGERGEKGTLAENALGVAYYAYNTVSSVAIESNPVVQALGIHAPQIHIPNKSLAGAALTEVVTTVATLGRAGARSAAAKAVPNPGGRLGSLPHRETVARRAAELEAQDHTILAGGGRLPERAVVTPSGKRRFPDISTRDPSGKPYYENVGRSTSSGQPVARERRALEDIEKATGTKPGYTPYDR